MNERRKITPDESILAGGCLTLVFALLIGAFLLLVGCKTIEREVPVTIEHTTERVRVDHVRDTLYRHDSVTTFIKGDTVVIERWHTLKGVNFVTHVDTLTERVEVPVKVKEVEVRKVNILRWWQKLLMGAGAAALLAIAVVAAYKARKMAN